MSDPVRVITITADELDARIEAAVEAGVRRAMARPEPTEWMDVSAAAKLLGVSTRTVSRLAKAGTLPAARVGGILRFSRAAIDERLRRAG